MVGNRAVTSAVNCPDRETEAMLENRQGDASGTGTGSGRVMDRRGRVDLSFRD
jgi:hypothetical protein